jgi:phosphoglycolate phosphatase
MALKGFLFDKDATLLDFDRTWGVWCAGYLKGLAAGDEALLLRLSERVGFDLVRQTFLPDSPVIAGTPEEGVDIILPLLPGWERDALLAHANDSAGQAAVYPLVPLAPLLDALKQGHKLGVATNDAEKSARQHIDAFGVADRFDAIIGSDSGFGGKPGPGMCLAFAEQTGLDPREVAMVGDSTHDLFAGRAAGMVCIGVASGYATAEQLAPHADVVLPDVSHLPAWRAEYGEAREP